MAYPQFFCSYILLRKVILLVAVIFACRQQGTTPSTSRKTEVIFLPVGKLYFLAVVIFCFAKLYLPIGKLFYSRRGRRSRRPVERELYFCLWQLYLPHGKCQAKHSNFSCFPLWGEWILRASQAKDERGHTRQKSSKQHRILVTDLYRLDFHFIPSSHFPQRGKQERLVYQETTVNTHNRSEIMQ